MKTFHIHKDFDDSFMHWGPDTYHIEEFNAKYDENDNIVEISFCHIFRGRDGIGHNLEQYELDLINEAIKNKKNIVFIPDVDPNLIEKAKKFKSSKKPTLKKINLSKSYWTGGKPHHGKCMNDSINVKKQYLLKEYRLKNNEVYYHAVTFSEQWYGLTASDHTQLDDMSFNENPYYRYELFEIVG